MHERSTISENPQQEIGPQKENVCSLGYRPTLNGDSCLDIDECAENIHSCEPKEKCVNDIGSYRCESFIEEPTSETSLQVNKVEKGNETEKDLKLTNENKTGEFESTADEICPLGFSYNDESTKCEGKNLYKWNLLNYILNSLIIVD